MPSSPRPRFFRGDLLRPNVNSGRSDFGEVHMLVVWNQYKCTVSGSIWKIVDCEQCQQVYVYPMTREVTGEGTSLYFLNNQGAKETAESEARSGLACVLEEDCDAVPC